MSSSIENRLRRSPELLSRTESALLIVDVQEKLLGLISGWRRVVWNIGRLIDGAQLLGVPCTATEQYPQGLGPSHPDVAARLPERPSKQRFSCVGCGSIPEQWAERGLTKIVVAGIETHVCILQTVLDLLSEGFRVYVVADAVGARHPVDHEIALRRMDSQGAILTTCESVLFEWCESSAAVEFKQVSQLIRQTPPEE